jgi:NTE family protein
MKNVGYVLSGGGVRGFAHLGIIKYLEEQNIQPTMISGTSAGAIVGALYAVGLDPEAILHVMKNNSHFGWNAIAWRDKGIFSMDALRNVLKKYIIIDEFSSLKIPLYVTATDFVNNTAITFSEGPLIDAIVASCSIPFIFKPINKDNYTLIDGGVLNNFPIEPLIGQCELIIGSHVNKIDTSILNNESLKVVDLLDRCFHMAISKEVNEKKSKCHLFIESPLHPYNMFDLKAADTIFEIGYNTAKSFQNQIEQLIQHKTIS